MSNYSVSQEGAVTTIEIEEGSSFLITSDVHFDSVHCNRRQFFKDMALADEVGAKILIVGDFFDAMNGRFDPRRDMSTLRPEYRRPDYYDYIVKDAAKLLDPIAHNLLFVSAGNHERSVLKNANTDLIARLSELMFQKNHYVYIGGYGGIILVKESKVTTPIKYFHGSGGEAPVTRGAIQTNRQAVFLPDFQVILNGHSHNMYWIPIVRERVSPKGKHYYDIQHHVRTPGYLMSYADGSDGWEVSRGGVPKPVGSFMLTFTKGVVQPSPIISAPKPVSPIMDIYSGTIYPQDDEEGVKNVPHS
jgi:hypothetical protein